MWSAASSTKRRYFASSSWSDNEGVLAKVNVAATSASTTARGQEGHLIAAARPASTWALMWPAQQARWKRWPQGGGSSPAHAGGGASASKQIAQQ